MLGRDRKPIYRWLKRGVPQEVKVLRGNRTAASLERLLGERDKSKAK
jgi:hypothetical protein